MINAVCLFLGLLFNLSEAEPIPIHPQPLENLNLTLIQNVGSCSYQVSISTSCSSPVYTRDQISLSFGDAYGNQVYAPRLDDLPSRTFEQCSTDTFKIRGPCAYQICYVYVYRSGPDGWKPTTVQISGSNQYPVRFNYNVFIPRDIWYGFNLCESVSSAKLQPSHGWFVSAVIAVLSFFSCKSST
ncbi:Embryo-specific protein 3 (ATS3) [Euphorbia peplus]|nr:Embryo-specific protein 3 (ATS3) [Euphorbia peplus]